jgi:dCTP deaminase
MTVLSDHSLEAAIRSGRILTIEPLPTKIEPASIDLHLSNVFLTLRAMDEGTFLDPLETPDYDRWEIPLDPVGYYTLDPGTFALGSTIERIGLSREVAAQVDGKSSLGRMGLLIHCTAGWIDPGFQGALTLEFFNATSRPIRLRPAMPIAQLVVHRLSGTASMPYGGRYARSDEPIGSKGVKPHASA